MNQINNNLIDYNVINKELIIHNPMILCFQVLFLYNIK